MALGCLAHQRKRFSRRRSLIFLGPEAIRIVVENPDLTCPELLSQSGVHRLQFLRSQPRQGGPNLAYAIHGARIPLPGHRDKSIRPEANRIVRVAESRQSQLAYFTVSMRSR